MANDQIERLVNILIELKGAEETERAIDEMYDSAKKGSRDAKKGAEEAEPKINLFLQRWKTQALTLAAALGGLWGLAKYSSVASGMTNMLGASLGLLEDTLLVHLVEPAAWASEKIMELTEWFDGLPEPIQKLTSYVLGLGLAFGVLKTLGITGLVSSIAGGTAAAAAWITAIAAGLALGLVGVAALVYSGALDWVAEAGRGVEDKFPWLIDVLKQLLWPLAILGVAAIDLVTGRIDKIPEDVGIILKDVYDAWERSWDRVKSLAGTAQSRQSRTGSGPRSGGVVDWIGGLNPFANWQAPNFPLPSLPSLRVPHACGDEPTWTTQENKNRWCSPCVWR